MRVTLDTLSAPAHVIGATTWQVTTYFSTTYSLAVPLHFLLAQARKRAVVKSGNGKQRAHWTGFLLGLILLAAAEGLAQGQSPAQPPRQVVVSLRARKLAVLQDGAILGIFQIAVGADSSPSPTGEFEIVNRVSNPTYYHAGQVIPSGKDNPIGTRWVGLNRKGYGIHGTNAPRSIGKAASHGCIRLRNRDMEQLFTMLRSGDRVEIRGDQDRRIAQIFGGTDQENTTVATSEIGSGVAGGQ
ncbi:MAG TPA: L,D-transpeptidase [Terriglobales bacterium]|nr:L,D-transpeptidase [Terriglobales bacterium]